MRNKNLFGETYITDKIVPAMPYMGNKRKIATKLLNVIYRTIGDFENLYDLFGGGGSVSVAGLLARHNVYYNELNTGIFNLMKHIQEGGKLPNKWITREEFYKHKNSDDWYSGFIKCCWSFGNNQEEYLFGKDIEELKRRAHEYLLANGYNGTSENRNNLLKRFKKENNITDRFELERLEWLQQLQQLQQLERLQQLQRLQWLQRLDLTNLSYNQVEIKLNSVIYCDPPYQGTTKYQKKLDHNKFYKWCLENKNPVFISGYNMPKEFTEVASFEHRSTLSPTTNNLVVEKLYWNNKKYGNKTKNS